MERGQPEFTVVVDDLAYKLTLGAKIRTFAAITFRRGDRARSAASTG